MYSNSHAASALAVALLFLLPQDVRAQSWGYAFSSEGSGRRTPRNIRYEAEPDLVFKWTKTKGPDVKFDPEIAIAESDLVPLLFPVVTGGDLAGDKEVDSAPVRRTDPYRVSSSDSSRVPSADSQNVPSPDHGQDSSAIPRLISATDGTIRPGRGGSVVVFPAQDAIEDGSFKQRAIARIDDYSHIPHSRIFEKVDDSERFRYGGDAFAGEAYSDNSGYNTGSQTEQIIDVGGPMPKIDYSKVRPLRKTLHDIWQTESAYMEVGKVPTKAQRARLALLYKRAAGQEDNQVMSFYYRARSHLIVKNLSAAFAELDNIYKLSPDNDTIFKQLAEEFRYEEFNTEARIIELYPKGIGRNSRLRLLATSGLKALERHDWDTAWQKFEQVYDLKPNGDLILEIAYFYYQEGRNMETCVWCSRCLPVADHWDVFESAWTLRGQIEAQCYAEFLSNEPKITLHWSASKVPLKVYFEPEAEADGEFYILMEQCLRDWMFVARGKLDFELVSEEDKADLTISRPQIANDTRYDHFRGGASPPTDVPHPQPLGLTPYESEGPLMSKAQIIMYDAMQDLDEQTRLDVYLHEIGHALGLIGHSKDHNDIMYGYGRQSRESLFMDNNVSHGDAQRLRAAYKDVPLNEFAVEQYTGMKALCQRLNDNPQSIANLELPDHLANLMPVLDTIDINEAKVESDDSDSESASGSSGMETSEELSRIWSPSTHYMPEFPGLANLPTVVPLDDPISNYPVRTGQQNFDMFRDLPDL